MNVQFLKNCENMGKILSENVMGKMSFWDIWHSFSWAPIRNFYGFTSLQMTNNIFNPWKM